MNIYIYIYIYIRRPQPSAGERAREKVALRRLWRPSSMSYGHLPGAFPWPFSSMFLGLSAACSLATCRALSLTLSPGHLPGALGWP